MLDGEKLEGGSKHMASGLGSGVTSPEVIGRTKMLPESILNMSQIRRRKKLIPKDEKNAEIRRSSKAFEELALNGVVIHLLNIENALMPTTSKQCGEGEYMFIYVEGIVRIWRGGTSVFEDGDATVLWHRPHMAIDLRPGNNLRVVTNIQEFELNKITAIFSTIVEEIGS